MRRLPILAVAFVLVVSACGSASTNTATTSTTVKTFTNASLQAVLVPLEMLPSGYSVSPPDNSTTSTQLCNKGDLSALLPHQAKAEVTYLGGQLGPGLFQTLSSYASNEQAKSAVAKARQAVAACTKFNQTDKDGTVTHYTVSLMSFTHIAQDQFAFRMTLQQQSASGTLDVVVIPVGNLIVLTGGLSLITFLGNAQLKPGDFQKFTVDAYTRAKSAVTN